ncbi:MAG: hypothetical protein ACI90U_000809 [Pseudomonadales bacterium]|jgi:hypothetical protein
MSFLKQQAKSNTGGIALMTAITNTSEQALCQQQGDTYFYGDDLELS